MMSFIANAGAVPLGFVSEMIDSDVQFYLGCSDRFVSENMHWRYLRQFGGHPPLPDVVLSNTPPPSPLRRTISCPFLPPSNAKEQSPETLANTGAEVLCAQCNCRFRSRSNNSCCSSCQVCACEEREGANDFHQNATSSQQYHQAEDGHDRLHHCRKRHPAGTVNLPQLLWEVPPCSGLCQGHLQNLGNSEVATEEETPEGRARRSVGVDLRKIADRFQLEHGKVTKKTPPPASLSLDFPVAFTRCLSASVLCLIWWRLLNRFR